MSKIDINLWQYFPIGRLFHIHKGKRLTKADMKDGNIRFIGASAANNGITSYISNCEHLHPQNTITLSYNGSIGEAFYQDEIFWASDDVNVLYPKFEMNKEIALFIIPLLKTAGKRYAFINKWKKENMEKTEIPLPVDKDGNPDFAYMEEYMQNREIAVSASLTKLQSAKRSAAYQKIDTSTWGIFEISKILPIIQKPFVYHTKHVVANENGIPYVVRSKYNNGIKYRVKKPNGSVNPAGVISFGAENATFFYQKEEWVSGRDIYYLDTQDLSEYACLFIIACLQPIASKYSYNFGLFPELLRKEKVKLPMKSDGAPDYDYMSDFIAEIKNQSENTLLNLQAV